MLRPGGAVEDLAWEPPEGFVLETVVPDRRGGLYLVAALRTLHLGKGARKPTAFAEHGSGAGATWLAGDGTLLLGQGGRVQRLDARGRATLVAKGFGDVRGVAQDARGRVLVADWTRGEIVRVDGARREVLARGLSHPSGLAFCASGRLLVTESGRQTGRDLRVLRLEADGALRPFATVPTVSRRRAPQGAGDGAPER